MGDAKISCTPYFAISDGVLTSISPTFVDLDNMDTFDNNLKIRVDSITIPDTVHHISKYCSINGVITKEFIIPDSVTTIGKFPYTGKLDTLVIPDSVTAIADYAFNCCKIKNVIIGSGISEIPKDAFSSSEIESIHIPHNVTTIGEYAFQHCRQLISITIPNSVDSIGLGAFEGCTSLEVIKLSRRLKKIEHHTFSDCTSLTDIEIPNKVDLIGSAAFANCTSIMNMEIPASVSRLMIAPFKGWEYSQTIEFIHYNNIENVCHRFMLHECDAKVIISNIL